ncbi:MAG: twin-arginine translocase TatA/TatE family subunit [Acidothermus sp.]|nr:twin-arginine translocase TatA/TatE family subunit [Acidothermus sp.]MCL6538019.1 twin-arginine translocase TatA/TatE family subunit [Acidothermus sp.]
MDNPLVWVAIAVAALVLFGGKRLPDAARGLGRSLRVFRAEVKGLVEDDEQQRRPAPAELPQGTQQGYGQGYPVGPGQQHVGPYGAPPYAGYPPPPGPGYAPPGYPPPWPAQGQPAQPPEGQPHPTAPAPTGEQEQRSSS